MPNKRWLKCLVCITLLLCLCGCSVMENLPDALKAGDQPAALLPDLRQLSMPEPRPDTWQPAAPGAQVGALQVDLWLDASQVMGGINPNPDSIYPHRSSRYREGGFHYRYEGQTGWYETLLRHLLAAGEGSRIRVLRNGNEQFTDEQLLAAGLAQSSDPETLRSLRRDLLTYAVDPMPSLFNDFSAPGMDGSFYSLYTPKMDRIAAVGGQRLENPAQADAMAALVQSAVTGYNPRRFEQTISGLLTPAFSPLTTALENLDLNRLSVITCDPLTLRRLSGTAEDGSPVGYVETLLRQRGVFDRGMTVQLYAFQLDYMGQIHTINGADLRHPLIWGRLDYNASTKKIAGALPMPRTLLMLVVGTTAHVDAYTAALETRLAGDESLKELRGPQKGQLRYTKAGEAVTQEPFGFSWETLRITRHSVSRYTPAAAGMTLSLSEGEGSVVQERSLPTVAVAQEQSGNCRITLTWPLSELDGGLTMSAASLPDLQISPVTTLLLTDTCQNAPDAVTPAGNVQTLTLRDTLYHFTLCEGEQPLPFTADGLRITGGGTELTASFTAPCADLRPGYYRLLLHADVTGEQLAWPDVPWTAQLNANVTNQLIDSWQQVGEALQKRHKNGGSVPNLFWHAWGDKPGYEYIGVTIPDCPPVYAAPRLSELVTQLQDAAQIDSLPLVYAQLDVFVAPAAQLP
ncbi:MAG: hypothetical protein IKK08_09910 [Clostridia bacterium]|nr:hypothetical protein [Clostridia bacterium]